MFTNVDLEKNPKGFDYYANRLRRVASDEALKGKLVFNIGDKEDFSYMLEDYTLNLPGKKDVGVGIKDGANHYGMVETFSVDHVKAFVTAFLQDRYMSGRKNCSSSRYRLALNRNIPLFQ